MKIIDISLRTLAETCVLGPRLVLPLRDFLGNLTGKNYNHAEFAPAPPFNGTYGETTNLRGGKPFVYCGAGLRKLDFPLKTLAFACDVRCYVPVYLTDAARDRRKPDVTLDRLITVEPKRDRGHYHLHAIHTRRLAPWKVQKLAKLGVSCERLDLSVFSPTAYENAMKFYVGLRLSNIELLRVQAAGIAAILRRSSETPLKKRLERLLMAMEARPDLRATFQCVRCDLDDLYRWTYAAIVLGYLPVDCDYSVAPHLPIRLLSSRRRNSHVSTG
ncbi:hypothetical protein [Cupriavidus phytorum]|nr:MULTISPECIES: hypothetical protein [Cupriavidus]